MRPVDTHWWRIKFSGICLVVYTLIYKIMYIYRWIYTHLQICLVVYSMDIYIERERFKSIETLPWHGWVLQLPVVADSADSGGRDSSRLLPQLPTAFTCGGFARLLCSVWTSYDIIWHDPSYNHKFPEMFKSLTASIPLTIRKLLCTLSACRSQSASKSRHLF